MPPNKYKKIKIVLFGSNTRYVGVPLGLLSIAELLDPKKYDIHIITKNEYPNFKEEVLKQCDGALCLGISTITGFPVSVAREISEMVKKKYPHLPIIWGGWQATTLPEETLKSRFVDYICMGQGERTFKQFIDILTTGNPSEFARLSGFGYKKRRKLYITKRHGTEEIDSLPDFNVNLINWEKYLEVTDFGKKVLRISTSYGCPYRCAFCCEPFNSQRIWKTLSPNHVIRLLKKIRKKVKFDGIMIVDSNFFVNEKRVVDICKGLIRNKFNIKFGQVNGRTNNLVRYKPASWKLMKKAGLYNILIGAESGSEDTLAFIHKDATVQDTLELGKICSRHKILLVASVIIGLPTEKYFMDAKKAFLEDLNGIIELYKKISLSGLHHHLLVFPYAPLPFSPLYEKAKELGFIPPIGLNNWSQYEFTEVHVPWIPKQGFRKVQVLNYVSTVVGIDYTHVLNSLPKIANILLSPGIKIFKTIGQWRFQAKFLDFPIDMWIFNFGMRTFISLNKKLQMINIGG